MQLTKDEILAQIRAKQLAETIAKHRAAAEAKAKTPAAPARCIGCKCEADKCPKTNA